MAVVMVAIPPVLDTDAEDVAWALQTAEALWRRHERVDAIVWLRRAAQAAGEVEDDDRALALARDAAELAEWIARNPAPPAASRSVRPRPSSWRPPAATDPVDDLLSSPTDEVDVEDIQTAEPTPIPVELEEEDTRVMTAPARTVGPERARPRAGEPARASPAAPKRVLPPPTRPPAAPIKPPLTKPARPPPTIPTLTPPAESPTKAASAPTKTASAPTNAPPPSEPRKAPPSEPRRAPPPEPARAVPSEPPRAPAPEVPSAAEKHVGILDPWAEQEMPIKGRDLEAAQHVPRSEPRASSPSHEADDVVTSAPPVSRPGRSRKLPPPLQPAAPPPRVTKPSMPSSLGVDLANIDALTDLPDDARSAFGEAATVQQLRRGEEVLNFALALVLEGSVDVAAAMGHVPAHRLEQRAVLRARGTIDDATPLRLIGSSEIARVAIWDEVSVKEAFGTCPWVEDDLRAAGDRVQAEVGVTMGLLGERLDPGLRAEVLSKLVLRVLVEGETYAARGKPLPGLLLIGAGALQLFGDDDLAAGKPLRAGEFLFPTEVLRAAPAPATVRAAKGGAIVLFVDRRAAQELVVTCPPLLEILAGA
jgi:hypothetical protein